MKIYVVPDPNETKLQYLKRRASAKFGACRGWVSRTKVAAMVLTPVVIGGLTTIVKVVGERSYLRKGEAVKYLSCCDLSLGHFWALRRELSGRGWLDIGLRETCGERLSDILAELKVLK